MATAGALADVALAGALVVEVPARWAEMAVTKSPLRMRDPPEIPSWLARA